MANKWVTFKKTYSGPEGVFGKGHRCCLPEAKLKAIGTKYYKVTCPPWDDKLDPKVIAANDARVAYDNAKADFDRLGVESTEADEADELAHEAFQQAQAKAEGSQAAANKIITAAKAAREKANKTGASEGSKKKAVKLTAQAADAAAKDERCQAERMLAEGQLMVASAQHTLLVLSQQKAAKAGEVAAKALKKLGIDVEPEPKSETEDSENEKDTATDTDANAEAGPAAKDDAVSEGQTTATGNDTDVQDEVKAEGK